MADPKAIVPAEPDLARDGVVRRRCCGLQGVVAERSGVAVHERTLGRLLRRLRPTRLQPSPHDPERDEAAQALVEKASRPL